MLEDYTPSSKNGSFPWSMLVWGVVTWFSRSRCGLTRLTKVLRISAQTIYSSTHYTHSYATAVDLSLSLHVAVSEILWNHEARHPNHCNQKAPGSEWGHPVWTYGQLCASAVQPEHRPIPWLKGGGAMSLEKINEATSRHFNIFNIQYTGQLHATA